MSGIAGVEGGGESRMAGHWLEVRSSSLGMLDLESKLPRHTGYYALELGAEHEEDKMGRWRVATMTAPQWFPR